MAVLLYHTFAFFALFSYGIYHLICATRSLLKPHSSSSSRGGGGGVGESVARPYHPIPLPSHRHHLLRHLPLYLAVLCLLVSISHHAILSTHPDTLVRGRTPVHRFTSLQSSTALLLFLLLAVSLLLPGPFTLPHDLLFLLASLAFALLSAASTHSAASYHPSDLQSKCESLSSLVSAASAALALALAVVPRLFLAELALAASLSLQGLWSLQTGLSLYVEGFIPEGCHRLLDVPEASTRCDLEDSRLRAAALLDLAFVLHTTFTAVVAVVVYASVARAYGGLVRRLNGGSYEALPTSSSAGTLTDLDHVQMKALTKNSMQA